MARGSEQRRTEKERGPEKRPEKKRDAPRAEKKRAPGRPEHEKTPRKRPEKKRDEDTRDPRTIRASADPDEQQRPAVEELGGESEYSMHEAQRDERGSTHRKRRDGYTREPLTYAPEPGELGRRYLEDATQAPATDPRDSDEEPVLLPHEPD